MSTTSSTTMLSQPTISADAAARVLDAGLARAHEEASPVTIAVVDAFGTLKCLSRADGAVLMTVDFAQRKAHTAVAAGGVATSDLYGFISQVPALLATLPHLPDFALATGGVPLRDGESLIGAVGVSGGTPDQDEDIARAAAAALPA